HLAALAIDHETVRQQRAKRRAAVDSATGEQRRLKPAAMLIRAFQVKISRLAKLRPSLEHAHMRGARIEPHIERIGYLAIHLRIIAEQLSRIETEPSLDPLPLDTLRYLFDEFQCAR